MASRHGVFCKQTYQRYKRYVIPPKQIFTKLLKQHKKTPYKINLLSQISTNVIRVGLALNTKGNKYIKIHTPIGVAKYYTMTLKLNIKYRQHSSYQNIRNFMRFKKKLQHDKLNINLNTVISDDKINEVRTILFNKISSISSGDENFTKLESLQNIPIEYAIEYRYKLDLTQQDILESLFLFHYCFLKAIGSDSFYVPGIIAELQKDKALL